MNDGGQGKKGRRKKRDRRPSIDEVNEITHNRPGVQRGSAPVPHRRPLSRAHDGGELETALIMPAPVPRPALGEEKPGSDPSRPESRG